jgi:hypothetical protein
MNDVGLLSLLGGVGLIMGQRLFPEKPSSPGRLSVLLFNSATNSKGIPRRLS